MYSISLAVQLIFLPLPLPLPLPQLTDLSLNRYDCILYTMVYIQYEHALKYTVCVCVIHDHFENKLHRHVHMRGSYTCGVQGSYTYVGV